MSLLHDNVFDAALNYISSNGVTAEVQNSTGSALISGIALTAGNYGSPVNNTSSSAGGRTITCLTSSASDMKNISVGIAGSATKVAIKDASASTPNTLVVASIASAPIALGASDQVNLSTFSVILKDPV